MSAPAPPAELDGLGLPPAARASASRRGGVPRQFLGSAEHPPLGSQSILSPTRPGLDPAWQSPVGGFEAAEPELHTGMAMLGFGDIKPQQVRIAQVCNSTGEDGLSLYSEVAIDVPRRSGKSETATALALGRCWHRPGYRVGITFATTATKLAARWKQDIFERIEAWSDEHYAGVVLGRSNGHEFVGFPNGSRLLLLPPKQSAFRSEAFDLVVIDESGEASASLSELLIQAAGPTQDTRPGSQTFIAGTPATFRDGNLLWDAGQRGIDDIEAAAHALEHGRDDEVELSAIIRYGIREDLTVEDIDTWDNVVPLLRASHPGLDDSTDVPPLTTLAKLRANYRKAGPMMFAQEYLGQYGREAGASGIIVPARWTSAEAQGDLPELPPYFAVAVGASIGQEFAGVGVAWRDALGSAHVGLLEFRPETAWLPEVLNELAAAHPRVPIVYDPKNAAVKAEVEKITQARAKTRLHTQTWLEVQTAAALLVREVHRGNLIHYGQEPLTDAALVATRRGDERSYAFGRPSPDVQIVALEVVSLALRAFDAIPRRTSMPRLVA